MVTVFQFRESISAAREQAAREAATAPPTTRPSEPRVVGEDEDDEDGTNNNNNDNNDQRNQLLDPLIFPGLYSPSGFNIMNILVSSRESISVSHQIQMQDLP
jgi:hypothetical protein